MVRPPGQSSEYCASTYAVTGLASAPSLGWEGLGSKESAEGVPAPYIGGYVELIQATFEGVVLVRLASYYSDCFGVNDGLATDRRIDSDELTIERSSPCSLSGPGISCINPSHASK